MAYCIKNNRIYVDADCQDFIVSCYNSDYVSTINDKELTENICEFLNNEQTFNEILLENRALRIENERLNNITNKLLQKNLHYREVLEAISRLLKNYTSVHCNIIKEKVNECLNRIAK